MLIIRKVNSLSLRLLTARSKPFIRDFSDSKKDDNDNDSEHDSKKKPKKESVKEETAADRLNKLLASMQTDDNLNLQKNVIMAKPGAIKKRPKKEDSKNVLEALKKVASHLGDENKQRTESELLNKLLNHTEIEASTKVRIVKEDKANTNELSLSDLIVGMKIDRRQPAIEYSRGDYVRKSLASRPTQKVQTTRNNDQVKRQQKRQPEPNSGSVNLFGGKGLNIFKDTAELRDSVDILKTWKHLNQHDLKLAITHPPANYFQKMGLWTEQDKLWKFPVDNEQGLEEEAATDFSEHVFLEQYLENWCTTKGPIRHFMELVCVGLSKNPYISAKDKKAHILWYRDYFEEKKDILKDVIVEQKKGVNEANISKS